MGEVLRKEGQVYFVNILMIAGGQLVKEVTVRKGTYLRDLLK
jgi:hypothetical protein